MREILFDTETTGVFPEHQDDKVRDRIVEIGCVEVINLERTGREFHAYLNPDRDVPEEVVRVHGLRLEFLRNHKRFAEIAADFMEFIGDAPLVAHNAAFDQGFLNAELRRCKLAPLGNERFVDTLAIARKRFPGASCSLDALAQALPARSLRLRSLHAQGARRPRRLGRLAHSRRSLSAPERRARAAARLRCGRSGRAVCRGAALGGIRAPHAAADDRCRRA